MAVTNTISNNLAASISDHFPQFLVVSNIFFNSSYHKSNNYEKDWSRFDGVLFAFFSFSM